MTQEKMYILLKKVKYKLTRQQYNTIKGQINCGDVQGAYKGIIKLLKTKDNLKKNAKLNFELLKNESESE